MGLLVAQESNTERQGSDKRKDSFIEEAGTPGEKGDSCPQRTNSQLPIREQELLKEGFRGTQASGAM